MQQKPDYLVLVNSANRLPADYEETVERITVQNNFGDRYQVEKKTYEAFLHLQKDLWENDGIQTELISAYRTVETQEKNFQSHLERFGEEYTYKYVAKPGHSEHHTGIAIDVGIVTDGKLRRRIQELLEVDELFHIVQAKLPKHGFILRYPRDKEAVTGIGYECWHFRYLDDPALAQEITDKGWCFEEYWANKA
jgi:LAS superfamily LD-carboxypeptidase LdcB